MKKQNILIIRGQSNTPHSYKKNELIITSTDLLKLITQGSIFRHFFRYQQATLLTEKLNTLPNPLFFASILHFLALGRGVFTDHHNRRQTVTLGYLAKLASRFMGSFLTKCNTLRRINKDIARLEHSIQYSINTPIQSRLSGQPAYLRTDLVFGLKSGGSVGHIAGVLNNLAEFLEKPLFLSTDWIPTVRTDLETHFIQPDQRYWDFRELPELHFNATFTVAARQLLQKQPLSFIYQRYSRNNYAGVALAREFGVPFVLEYNGSEVWIGRHWGRRLKYEGLSERIELLNLKAADVVVVVSRPIHDELVARGIDSAKILVNPNGVNERVYSPNAEGAYVRDCYNLTDKTIIGFIGTFGDWHGADVLAEAFGELLRLRPDYRETVRLLMIGDGKTMPKVRAALARHGAEPYCVLTGLVPQEQGPDHLAACDVLASPHVPNPDGTPFFGSPTKLFEYMAMGKGIVASNLDQIGEVLEHGRTGWLVRPGDTTDLACGLQTLIDDADLRARLGAEARREVVACHTWRAHTERIIAKLRERCGAA